MRKRSEWATYYFAVLSPVMFPLGLTAQTMSVFITVASAFDCLVLVAASEKFKSKFCSVNTSILVSQCIPGIIEYFDSDNSENLLTGNVLQLAAHV